MLMDRPLCCLPLASDKFIFSTIQSNKLEWMNFAKESLVSIA